MCFSAPASFIASAGLFIIGAVAIVKSNTRPQRVLASMPLLFAVQQLSEGFMWLSFCNTGWEWGYRPAMYVFLLFAQVLWPVFVPLSIQLLEKERRHRIILRWFLGLGLFTALYFLLCLFTSPVSASVEGHHIRYDLEFPGSLRWISGLFYLLAAIAAPFASSQKRLWLIGAILLVSYLITRLLFQDYLVSVWCYFAAVLSAVVLAVILHLRKEVIAKRRHIPL